MDEQTRLKDLISDAVEDDLGNRYLAFGDDENRVYTEISSLHTIDSEMVERLARVGVHVISTSAKEALKRLAQSTTDFRAVSIAQAPGWTRRVYATPDGCLVSRRPISEEIITAFETDDAFAPSCNLRQWQQALSPLVADQPLALFALAYSLVGPLLRFAPPDVQNAVVEFVGEPEKGKSTLAKLASSVWGGDPQAKLGICYDWDFTPAELDTLRVSRKDGLLVLDEVNRASRDEHEKAKIVGNAIFKLADTSTRKRFNQPRIRPIRQATLSTSNVPIRELSAMPAKTKAAMLSRILSLDCNRTHGILDNVPDGYENAQTAVEAMDKAATTYFGCAGPAFLKRLLKYRNGAFERVIASWIRYADKQEFAVAVGGGARASKTIGITIAAASIAQQVGVFPQSWGCPKDAFRAIFLDDRVAKTPKRLSALDQMSAFVKAHLADIVLADSDRLPLSAADFRRTPGVWLETKKRILLSPTFLSAKLDDTSDLLRRLRDEGLLSADAGQLTKKAPRRFVSDASRAHFVTLKSVL